MVKKLGLIVLLMYVLLTGCSSLDAGNEEAADISTSQIQPGVEGSSYDEDAADTVVDYLIENVPEISDFADYLLEESDGEVKLAIQVRSFPDEVAQDVMRREYYHIYVGESHPDRFVNWNWFAVKKDFTEILHDNIVSGQYETLEQWRATE